MSMFSILCIFPEKLGLQHCEYWCVCVWKAAAELNVITKLNSKNTSNPHFFEKLFFRHYLCWSSLDIYKFHVSFCLLQFFFQAAEYVTELGLVFSSTSSYRREQCHFSGLQEYWLELSNADVFLKSTLLHQLLSSLSLLLLIQGSL